MKEPNMARTPSTVSRRRVWATRLNVQKMNIRGFAAVD